jgi:hypothetical protein
MIDARRTSSERPIIDAGIPLGRDGWPDGVLKDLAKFAQGDIVKYPPFLYYADPTRPVWARTYAYAEDSEGPEIIELADGQGPPFGIITTQTCDIVEEDAERPVKPWVQIAPVEERSDLPGNLRKLLKNKKGPAYLVYLPALVDGFWVADFRIEVPVEKGWLSHQTRVSGFNSEDDQLIVGDRLAQLRGRPAFGKNLVDGFQRPLTQALRELRSVDRELLNKILVQVDEIAVQLDSHLSPADVSVTVLCTTPLDDDVVEWWGNWWDEAQAKVAEVGLVLHPFDYRLIQDVSLADYRRMTPVPLNRVSPD